MPIAPPDPALPALPELLSPHDAPPIVCEALRDMGIDADGARAWVIHVRYRPGKNCDIGWRFRRPSGWPGLISARVFRNDRGARIAAGSAFQQLAARAQEALGLSMSPYRYLEEHKTLLQLFPLDRRLPGLIDATSPAWANAALPHALDGGRAAHWRVAVRPKAYRAWRRCVLEYEREGDRPQRYFAKVYRDDRGAALLARLQSISQQLAGGAWQVVTPAAYLAEQRTLFLPAVDGVTFTSLIKAAAEDVSARQQAASASSSAAEGLMRFQQVEVDDLRVVTPRDVIETLRRKSARIQLVEPELAQALAERIRALETALDTLPPEPLVTAHGAFRHSQLLLVEGGLVVLDLDTLCRAGANTDAGNFLACLDRMAVRRERRGALARECQEAFALAWRRAPGAHDGWLAWHRAAALVKQAIRTYVALLTPWPQMTSELLQRADEVAAC